MEDATNITAAMPPTIPSTAGTAAKAQKSHDLVTCTIRAPPFSYAHLEILSNDPGSSTEPPQLDVLQVRSYCTSALKQFLGVTGTSIAIDILKVAEASCWLRLPRQDLGAFCAAITAWQGFSEHGQHSTLRVKGCSDWLGSLVGRDGEAKLWSG